MKEKNTNVGTAISRSPPLGDNHEFGALKKSLDQVCLQIARRFNLYNSKGKPCKATILSVMAESACLACISGRLSTQTSSNCVDALYTEVHRLAVNVLVEEIHNRLQGAGYNVTISTETPLEYGKADVTIEVANYGVNLKCKTKEILVEVKTGSSLSLCQLFRYLLEKRNSTIVVWRIRKRQILIFNAEDIELLLIEYMRMIYLRGARLLSSTHSVCQHIRQTNYSPTQEVLQKMFQDFAEALTETLPSILEILTKRLGI